MQGAQARRGGFLAVIPVAWALGLVCIASVLMHDGHGEQETAVPVSRYAAALQGCAPSSSGLWALLCCLIGGSKQRAPAAYGWSFSSISAATVAAHPADVGLAAAVFLPQLLTLLLATQLWARWAAQRAAARREATDSVSTAPAAAMTASSTAAASSAAAWAVRIFSSMEPAAFLAVAKLLPMACTLLVVLAGWLGLRQQRPAGQSLQLLHPLAAVLFASMSLLSQADAVHKLAISALHAALAGLLLAAQASGLKLPGLLTPLQAWLALVGLDVCLPAAAAWWQHTRAARPASGACPVGAQPAESAACSTNCDMQRRSIKAAAEPASPGPWPAAELHPASGRSSVEPDSAHSAPGTRPAPGLDGHRQPSTPGPQDTASSPNRRNHTPSPAAAAAAAATAPQEQRPVSPGSPESNAPLLSFEEALAACARGYAARQAAGAAAPSMALYQSQLHHHVVSIKAPLEAAQQGAELMQRVISHLNAAQASKPSSAQASSSSAGSSTSDASSSTSAFGSPTSPGLHPNTMMLRPVAMRGCLHMLLPVCLPAGSARAAAVGQLAGVSSAGSSCDADLPLRAALRQLSQLKLQPGPAAQGRPTQLFVQVDEGKPQLVVLHADGSWHLGDSNPDADGSSGPTPAAGSTTQAGRGGSARCWLDPPCLLLAPPASPGSTSSTGRPAVVVRGLPAEAGSLVRVLLVQGEAVLVDQLLPATLPSEAAAGCGSTRSVRLPLPAAGLMAGPAMVCVLAPPHSVAALAAAPAGVSPALAALTATHQAASGASAAEQLQSARMWACLPLLLVDSGEAEQQLSKLFADMRSAAEQQQQQSSQINSASTAAGADEGAAARLSSSDATPLASIHCWQPLLWDWQYAVQGADATTMLDSIPQLAADFSSAVRPPAAMIGSLYKRATVWSLRSPCASSSSAAGSKGAASRQAIISGLLDLLVGRDMFAAIQQLQAAVASSAALDGAASSSKPATSPADGSNGAELSPSAASRHDSCGSYNQAGALRGVPDWRPAVQSKDGAVPPLSRRKQALQEQHARYIQTLEAEAAEQPRPALQPLHRDQGHTAGSSPVTGGASAGASPGGEGRQPASRRASASGVLPAPASSAGLFMPCRCLSLDTLPMPSAAGSAAAELHPPRWSVDLPVLTRQQQQQQMFMPPSVMMGPGMLSRTSPTGSFGDPCLSLNASAAAMAASTAPLLPCTSSAAASAAAGAAAAQAALLQLQPGSFNSPGAASLPSPGMRQLRPGSASRPPLQASPMRHPAHLAHQLQPQPSLGYSPSLASMANSNLSAAYMSAEGSGGLPGYAGLPGGRSPAVPSQPAAGARSQGPVSEEEARAAEGRHWAVFDISGVEGFDQGLDTAATGNLASTTRRNSASSVTWLAIPTSQSGQALPHTAMRTPSTARRSSSLYSSSTGKLRRSEQQHTVSSSLTPQPPRSQSFAHHASGPAESAEYFGGASSSSGVIDVPGRRRQATRTMLFSPATGPDAASAAGDPHHHQQSFSPEDLSPPAAAGTGHRHMGGFSTPQRPGAARFVVASPRREGPWSPAPGQLSTLPTIGSEDSWDQNAITPSPGLEGAGQGGGVRTPLRGSMTAKQQQQLGEVPGRPLPAAGALDAGAWAGARTPGRVGANSRGPPLGTPHSVPRLPVAGVAATPRGAVYRVQQGSMTPGFYTSRTGNLVSASNTLEGDTVSGVLQLLAGPEGRSSTLRTSDSAVSGFSSSSSSSLAGTPDGGYGTQHRAYQGGYFTPVRPSHRGAALLPAVWAAPAAGGARHMLPGMSGSFAAARASGTGYAAVAPQQQQQQQQVPDTPLMKAGRQQCCPMFSPAPHVALGMQQQQQHHMMSTPARHQSLMLPPGSASRLQPAAAMLGPAAFAHGATHPAGFGGALAAAGAATPRGAQQQSSAAAAAALLRSPAAVLSSGASPLTPAAAPDVAAAPVSGPLSGTSSPFDTLPFNIQPFSEEDLHTPVQSPGPGSPARATTTSGQTLGQDSGDLHSGSRAMSLSSPPPAPARPVPGVVLVPAVEADDDLLMTEDGFVTGVGCISEEEFWTDSYMPEGYVYYTEPGRQGEEAGGYYHAGV